MALWLVPLLIPYTSGQNRFLALLAGHVYRVYYPLTKRISSGQGFALRVRGGLAGKGSGFCNESCQNRRRLTRNVSPPCYTIVTSSIRYLPKGDNP